MGDVKGNSKRMAKVSVSRREFFAALAPVLTLPAIIWLLFTAGRTSNSAPGRRKIILQGEVPAGMSIRQGIILVRNGDSLRAFEAKCTHLGCKLSKIEGEEVVCPCHGSRFNKAGMPVKGPASASLKERSVRIDAANNTTVIQ